MAKKSQRRLSRQERDSAGCISGLISIFDFRHGRSTKRLLADRRRVSKPAVGGGHLSNHTILLGPTGESKTVEDDKESKMPMADVAKTSVKELMEEEMSNEQRPANQLSDSERGSEQIDPKNGNHMKKHQKRNSRSCTKSSVPELDYNQVLERKTSDNLDLEFIMEELAQINQENINCTKPDVQGDLNIPLTAVEEKVVEAIRMFVEQRLSNSRRFGEEESYRCSKDFMDALQTLSSNKGLFLKLLQDQDSNLVKQIQNTVDARLGNYQTPSSSPANLSEEKPVNSKSDEVSTRKQRNFFRRRSKSMDSYPLGEDKDCQSSNKIVILKPGPGGTYSPETDRAASSGLLRSQDVDKEVHNERSTSQFSFTEIKRKLKHAMGKERQGVSPDRLIIKVPPKTLNWSNGEKGATGDNLGWSSPNRNHFYTERFAVTSPTSKKGEPVGIMKENGSSVVEKTSQYPKLGGSNIYIEAKKHLLEMLKSGDENPESVTGQLPKSLGRILSFPEYNGSPCLSPRKYGDDIFITAQMRLSPRGIGKNVNGLVQENHGYPSPRMQNMESQPCISASNSEDEVQSPNTTVSVPLGDDREKSLEMQPITEDTIVPEVRSSCSTVVEDKETTELRHQEEETTINISSESSSNLVDGDIQKGDTLVDNEESAFQFLKESHLFGEDKIFSSPTASPSYLPVSSNLEDPDYATNKMERPSPVSVLEPLFTDDDISPASTISQPVEKEIQPRHIHFEEQSSTCDQGICVRISIEDVESAFEYVEAVLLGSGLNWDDFLPRWLSLSEILDYSLFDEVELFSSRPRHDQKLLFDCANEALKEVCEIYFGSHVKPNIRPVPKGMDLIQEIWKRVEWHLSQHSQPHSLEQLVRRDLARTKEWMNLLLDIELIAFEMEETILDEMMEDSVLCFVDDTLECEKKAIEDALIVEDNQLVSN